MGVARQKFLQYFKIYKPSDNINIKIGCKVMQATIPIARQLCLFADIEEARDDTTR